MLRIDFSKLLVSFVEVCFEDFLKNSGANRSANNRTYLGAESRAVSHARIESSSSSLTLSRK